MGRGDNRKTAKIRRRISRKKYKARIQKRKDAGSAS